ncbi:circadian associated repressor of transcription a [Embiotoca jacksoni]|uniref:circadian associated repressor of transcription a n=1 Tax=Embiotoca jacksoni TaxID=100190 RepID=UPI003703AC9B
MNTLGNSSKWPSYDSLPSNSSFILSESEQTEDEADAFSEGEGDGGIRKSLAADEGIALSANYLNFPLHPDQLHSRSKCEQSEHCPDKTKHPDSASSAGAATLRSPSATLGDLAFSQKCADLHRFIHPLLELLHGLKMGRFERGLTSFQQSVAMDRLQRILGVLQKPDMGEKYLHNLLQIEMLLKIWFPQVAFKSKDKPNQTSTRTLASHWAQNQLHMPVKKRKMSWSDHDCTGQTPTKHNPSQHGKQGRCHAATSLDTVSWCHPASPSKQNAPEVKTVEPAEDSWTAGHQFKDGTVSLSGPSSLCSKRNNENRKQSEISPPSSCSSLATQDSSVSSSNNITTTDSP